MASDGQHFLMIKQEDVSTNPKALNVIVNWSEELARRARKKTNRALERTLAIVSLAT